MSGWWVHDLYQQPGGLVILVSWVFWVILSITLHELAHGWAAIWQGDDTPIRYNRMTMNPLVHMGGMSLIVFAIIGIAWGMMPVDPGKFRWRRQGRIVVSGAGPAMNIVLAIVALTVAVLWNRYGAGTQPLHDNVAMFWYTGGWLNLVLAAFNLLPIPPLDGSSILSGLSFRMYQFYQNPQSQMIGMFILLAIFISGVGGVFFSLTADVADAYMRAVNAILP